MHQYERELDLNNHMAMEVWEILGHKEPSELQIQQMEEQIIKLRQAGFFGYNRLLDHSEYLCLYWAARGVGFSETALFLNLPIEEVEKIHERILKKLNCMTLKEAVLKGLYFKSYPDFDTNKDFTRL